MATYKKLPAYIQDQLLPFQDVNRIKDNIGKVGALLGVLVDDYDLDYVPYLKLGGAGTSGGKLNFDGNTAKYVKALSDTFFLEVEGFDLNMPGAAQLIQGDRVLYYYHAVISNFGAAASYCLTTATATTLGNRGRTGSLLAIHSSFYQGAGPTNSPVITPEVFLNDSLMVAGTSTGVISATTVYTSVDTFARGDHPIALNDYLDVKCKITGSGSPIGVSGRHSVWLEVVLDGN